MEQIKVAPSILSGDFANMSVSVKNAQEWGADYIHFDVMDGVYVPNITFGMQMCKAIRPYTDLPLDVHLMIVRPEKYVEQFCDAGADIVSFHPDATSDILSTIEKIRNKGKKVGLVLNPDKDVSLIEPYFDKIDMVIIMGVYPGFGGQKFIPEVLEKVKYIRSICPDLDIELDGGVNEQNAKTITDAGVNILVGGSSVYQSSDPEKTIRRLKGE